MKPAREFGLLGVVALMLTSANAAPTHILAILIDDYGWADAGWHRPPGDTEISTPTMDALVKEGVELDRHYVYKFCSPTRSAAQTGRNPIHVNSVNLDPNNYNPADNVSGYSGVPKNMTGLGELMKRGGYSTHFFGKWDCGMATMRHTPRGRGYDTSLSCAYNCTHASLNYRPRFASTFRIHVCHRLANAVVHAHLTGVARLV
eukprot:m.165076 g.165076  ORF g.165076 m.165076 type:complete len:203 (-) comp23977_c0_seq1:26-634(-)